MKILKLTYNSFFNYLRALKLSKDYFISTQVYINHTSHWINNYISDTCLYTFYFNNNLFTTTNSRTSIKQYHYNLIKFEMIHCLIYFLIYNLIFFKYFIRQWFKIIQINSISKSYFIPVQTCITRQILLLLTYLSRYVIKMPPPRQINDPTRATRTARESNDARGY